MKIANRLLYILALVKLALPFFLQHGLYEPHRDELLYLAEGHHLAWGYMEVPPLLSVFAWLTNSFGSSLFWIKWWPALFGALTFLLTGKIIVSLGGKWFALLLGFLPFVAGVYLRVHFLFQPNFLEIFCWTLLAYTLVQYIQTKQVKWLYWFGAALGIGMMSKYTVAFYTLALLLGILLTRHRSIFSKPALWVGGLIGIVIFLPNLLWQYQHHFPVIFHMKELRQTQLQYVSPLSFLTDQLLMNLPTVFIWITGLFWTLLNKAARPYRFIGWAYIVLIVLLLVTRGKNYYALGSYPVLLAFGAYRLEQLTAARLQWLRYAMVALPVSLGIFMLPIALPMYAPEPLAAVYVNRHFAKTGALKWEDLQNHPIPQDFADMLGWDEMARKTAAAYNTMNSTEKKHSLLFCDNYGQAGAINYYRSKYPMPEAYSDNASFLYWMPAQAQFDNIVLVTDDKNEMQHAFIKEFQSAVLFDSVTNAYAREKGSLIIVLKGASPVFHQFFNEKLTKKKAAWHQD
jgi:Dolichyl-phosphate-mannose-protein mannosyltransferase